MQDAETVFRAIKKDKYTAAYYLLHYGQEDKLYKDQRAELESRGRRTLHPTETIAINLTEFERTHDSNSWLQAVEIVNGRLSRQKKRFLKARRQIGGKLSNGYRTGRPGWVIPTQHRYAELIHEEKSKDEEWVSEATLKRWWREIINQTVIVEKIIKGDTK